MCNSRYSDKQNWSTKTKQTAHPIKLTQVIYQMKYALKKFGYRSSYPILLLILMISLSFYACQEPPPDPEIIEITDEEARQSASQIGNEITVNLADGLNISLWASETMVKDPVALFMDDSGRAWVTLTNRSNSSEFDIRRWPQWTTESLKFRSVEDRRAFLREYFSPERSEENVELMPDRNNDGMHDWRDLTVEQEEVYVIEDLTGNGLANKSQLFFRDFHEEITDVAASVIYHDGDVFVGVAPDMWRIRDTTGDGIGDTKESISHGYGVHIGIWGHGISGLTVGPDGRLYWSIGDPGFNIVDKDGNHWDYPHQGAIFRSEPDGSNFEVFARGLRNTHEFAFDKYGNLITVDNDGDFPGEFERLLYVINGADGGWRTHWQFGKYTDPKNNNYNVWSNERYFYPPFEDQAAHVLPSLGEFHNGPAGMTYNPGTALNERWKDHFFVVSFVGSPVRSAINAITLEPDGASFRLASDEQFLSGIAGSGIDFGPDGALYFADWIQGWSQNQEGRIWKIDVDEDINTELRSETHELIGSSFDARQGGQIVELMGHEDMRVRQKAQFELVAREAVDLLTEAIDDDHQFRRIHGIWGIGQLGRQDSSHMETLFEWLEDDDPEIRAQAARMFGDVRYEPAGEFLVERLNDENPRVRFFAAEALGRISFQPAVDSIVEMLEENDDEDLFLRQAGAIALQRIGDVDALTALSDHSSRAVRVAAVMALKNLEDPSVARFLEDDDEFIVTNAARAINDDLQITGALPDLSGILEQHRFTNESLIRRAVNAAQYNGTREDADRLAGFALRGDVSEELRAEALAALSVWPAPSVLDRVSGRYRGQIENDRELAWQAIEPVIEQLLFDTPEAVRVAGVEAVQGLNYRPAEAYLVELLETDVAASVREAALIALEDLNYEEMEEVFALAMDDGDSSVRGRALEMLPESDIDRETLVSLLASVLEDGLVREQQQALTVLGQVDHQSAYDLLGGYMDELVTGTLTQELELELIAAVEQADRESLNNRLEQYQADKPDEPIARFRESLQGGDAERGRNIFYQHAAGQCMRCHVVDGSGSDVGPDLTEVGNRLSRELLLQSLVAPTQRLAPGYGSVTIQLDDGQTLQGLLEDETETTLTVRSGGESHQIEKTSIVERVNAPSGMPPMGEILTRSELRDLVEYMTTLQ